MLDAKVIGERLKKLRENKRLSQEELARALNTSRSAIAMYESGQRVPRDTLKVEIAKYYKKSVQSIFFV